ncbi:MAG: preprotein translocase subunit YajC [Myxococcota bacterium]|nr:preprotein translocase subunit YajC [Myxococcota bacterium]
MFTPYLTFVPTLLLQQVEQAPPAMGFMQAVPVILIVGIMYFLIIRPDSKRRKAHQQLLQALKKGDEIVTTGGIWGKVVQLEQNVATLEVSDRVKIKILKDRISGRWNPETVKKTA